MRVIQPVSVLCGWIRARINCWQVGFHRRSSLNISWGRIRKRAVGERVNGRAIFCLTDHGIASHVCQIRTGGGRVFITCDGNHGAVRFVVRFAVRFAVRSPESERAARIHGKRETSQIGLPIAQPQCPSTPRATHEIFRLGARQEVQVRSNVGAEPRYCKLR
jgi:hypothetical protein